MKKPKTCHKCDSKQLVIYIRNGIRLHVYKLSSGRIGEEYFYEDVNGYGQEIYCINCALVVYDLCGWGKESRWVETQERDTLRKTKLERLVQ
jgi:phenolic acid decarboxylase